MNASAPELTAILVNYNAGDELRTALASIAAEMAGRAWNGFVVDNASVDGSAAIAQEFRPEVTLVCMLGGKFAKRGMPVVRT